MHKPTRHHAAAQLLVDAARRPSLRRQGALQPRGLAYDIARCGGDAVVRVATTASARSTTWNSLGTSGLRMLRILLERGADNDKKDDGGMLVCFVFCI